MDRIFRRAFTLVELLVVIGIIGVLMAILLPTLNNARDRANTVKCMSNLRQIGVALNGYASENKGSLPWGRIWDSWNPNTFLYNSGNAGVSTWVSTLDGWMNSKRPNGTSAGVFVTGGARYGVSSVFRCPSVDSYYEQPCTYVGLPTAMPDWYWEDSGNFNGNGYISNGGGPGYPPRDKIRPAKLGALYSETMLVWDTYALKAIPANDTVGPLGPVFTWMDEAQLCFPQNASWRYRSPGENDPNPTDFYLARNVPILIPTRTAQARSNADSADLSVKKIQAGGPRFRHNREIGCNALFGDMAVRTMTWSPKRPNPAAPPGNTTYAANDIIRRMIMIRPPTGKAGVGGP